MSKMFEKKMGTGVLPTIKMATNKYKEDAVYALAPNKFLFTNNSSWPKFAMLRVHTYKVADYNFVIVLFP